jgi:hypothetical protein
MKVADVIISKILHLSVCLRPITERLRGTSIAEVFRSTMLASLGIAMARLRPSGSSIMILAEGSDSFEC